MAVEHAPSSFVESSCSIKNGSFGPHFPFYHSKQQTNTRPPKGLSKTKRDSCVRRCPFFLRLLSHLGLLDEALSVTIIHLGGTAGSEVLVVTYFLHLLVRVLAILQSFICGTWNSISVWITSIFLQISLFHCILLDICIKLPWLVSE